MTALEHILILAVFFAGALFLFLIALAVFELSFLLWLFWPRVRDWLAARKVGR